jgi:hypothetical protein
MLEDPHDIRVPRALLFLLGLGYVAWAAVFIARSAVATDQGRYFCLFDDAMVSLRYAWNLAHGAGLVWNPGERVEGITSLSWTLYMTLGALLLDKSAAVLFVQLTGIPLVLGVALLARRLSAALGGSQHFGLISAAAVLAYYPLSYWSLMGMETGCLAALSLSALLLALHLGSEARGSPLLGLLLGSMFATRPDAALPALVILVFRGTQILLRQRRLRALQHWLVEAAAFAGICGGLTLFRWLYYGSPVPNTYQLKVAGWPLLWRLHNGGRFVAPFLETSRYLWGFALCSLIFQREARRLLLLGFAGSVLAGQVWVGGDAWPYWRMLVPASLVLIVLAVDGAGALARWLLRSERRWLLSSVSLACSMVALYAADQPFLAELRLQIPAYMVTFNRATVQAGLELSRYADVQGSVAVAAAGAVPYYSGLRGVDVLGKSDRHIASLPGDGSYGDTVTPGHNKYDLHYSIEKLRPDAIYDAVALSRRPGNDVFEFVRRNYVQRGSFWLRRDSPHVHWDPIDPVRAPH